MGNKWEAGSYTLQITCQVPCEEPAGITPLVTLHHRPRRTPRANSLSRDCRKAKAASIQRRAERSESRSRERGSNSWFLWENFLKCTRGNFFPLEKNVSLAVSIGKSVFPSFRIRLSKSSIHPSRMTVTFEKRKALGEPMGLAGFTSKSIALRIFSYSSSFQSQPGP